MYKRENYMEYSFNLSGIKKIQCASFCCFNEPCVHPSRNMPVHDFIYMVDGEWSVGIGKTKFDLKNDEVLILPANIRHYGIDPCRPKTKTMFFHIYADGGDMIYDGNQNINCAVLENHIQTKIHSNIKSLFKKIIQTKNDEPVVSAYVTTLIYELSRLSQKNTPPSLADAIYEYITMSDKMPTNREIAAHFGVSTKTAETVFKSTYHSTLHSFVVANKLEMAREYLINYPNIKLASVAMMLGFYDEFHFSKAFKAAYGITPGELKKRESEKSLSVQG